MKILFLSPFRYYLHSVSSLDMTRLNSRPKKTTDFYSGQPIITAFDQVAFGQDIGYSYNTCSLGMVNFNFKILYTSIILLLSLY